MGSEDAEALNLICAGINHSNIKSDVRQLFPLNEEERKNILEDFIREHKGGCLFLATCDRCEFFLTSVSRAGGERAVKKAKNYLEDKAMDPREFNEGFKLRENFNAAEHLFSIACGLESRKKGEDEVLSQVKKAYNNSVEYGGCDTLLHELCSRALRAGKRARTETDIGCQQDQDYPSDSTSEEVEKIIDDELKEFFQWRRERKAVPLIKALKRKGEEIKSQELEEGMARLKRLRDGEKRSFEEEEREIIAEMAGQIVKKLLNDPIVNLKREMRESDKSEKPVNKVNKSDDNNTKKIGLQGKLQKKNQTGTQEMVNMLAALFELDI